MMCKRLAHGAALFIIKNKPNWNKAVIKEAIKKRVQPFFFNKRRRNPLIIVSILDFADEKQIKIKSRINNMDLIFLYFMR